MDEVQSRPTYNGVDDGGRRPSLSSSEYLISTADDDSSREARGFLDAEGSERLDMGCGWCIQKMGIYEQ